MRSSFITLRTGVMLALGLYLCLEVISAQTTSTTPTGGGKSTGGAAMSTTKSMTVTSAKGDPQSKAAEVTTKASKNETGSGNGSWRLESRWVFVAASAILFINRMSV